MRSSSRVVERARPLLGTLVAIRATGPAAVIDRAVDDAFEAIADVERRMSFHRRDSELSRINRLGHRAMQPVHRDTARVLRAALALAHASAGAFDPAVGARLVASGHLPAPSRGAPPVDATFRDVLLHAYGRVGLRRRVWLDLGGIAKGFAVDRALRVLRAAGIGAAIVNAGGDLGTFGAAVETVHVRDPADPGARRPLLHLRDGAVATSAGYFSARQSADGVATALVDPRDGKRLGAGVSVTVCAPRALWADALTKVVLASGAGALPVLRRLHAEAVILRAGDEPRRLSP